MLTVSNEYVFIGEHSRTTVGGNLSHNLFVV